MNLPQLQKLLGPLRVVGCHYVLVKMVRRICPLVGGVLVFRIIGNTGDLSSAFVGALGCSSHHSRPLTIQDGDIILS